MKLIENGIILIDKPVGITSFGVVARVRYLLKQKFDRKIKVGHTGTLDPFATGLLILVIGQKCKEASNYSGLNKSYLAEVVLGASTDTFDIEGIRIKGSNYQPSQKTVELALSSLIGEIWQTPPVFSAIKINGQRAYKIARSGKKIVMPKRQVVVNDIKIINYKYPRLTLETSVSSGTYIRSLAFDLGQILGTGAYLENLRRLSVGKFSVKDSQTLFMN